ncbi:DDE-type integrase/transposase/recombinase [bacterium]|nr:DDE-type integrase/transposase/recombinase [bacterium]
MGSVRISVGTEWLADGRTWRVVRQLDAERLIATDVAFQNEVEISRSEILRQFATGTLVFHTNEDRCSNDEFAYRQIDLRDLSEDDQSIVATRWRQIEPLTRLSTEPHKHDYQSRASDLREAGEQISATSLKRYFRRWKSSGGDRRALAPRTTRSGGRGRSRRSSFLSQYPALNRFVEEGIRDVYLTTARRPISAVTRRVLEDIQRLNSRLPSGKAQPIPKEQALSRAIARRIERMDPWEVDRQRWGRRIADQRHAPRSAQSLARRVLERVEVDHSPLKVVVGTKAGPIGQPWLTVLIDYYSRMIVGFCLGFDPPSYAVLMESLRHAILPKTGVASAYPSVKGDWPCFGIPEMIVCDRGADLTSNDLENAAFQLGVVLDFNPPRTPHMKGCVESFFGGLNDQLIAALPGRTFRSWEKRADYDADDGPLLPYDSLLEIIHVYLVDVYARSKHPTIPQTRLEVWQESAAEHPPFLPSSPDDLIVLLSKRAERTLSTRGIELGGMFYTSDDLLALRADLAANNLGSDQLTVRYNPWNLGSIRVLNPITGAYLRANAVDQTLEGLTEFQWKVLKRAVRERFDSPDHQMSLAEGRNVIQDIADRTMKKPSKHRRTKAARFLGESRSSGSNPESVETPPPSAADDDIPTETNAVNSPSSDHTTDFEFDDLDLDDWEVDTTST